MSVTALLSLGAIGILTHPPVLGFFGELGSDMTLVLKLFVLMAIYQFVTNHLGKGPLGIILFLLVSYFVIFDYFALLGGIYILYMMLAFGLVSVIVDFLFVIPGVQKHGHEGPQGPIENGKDFMERQHQLQHGAHQQFIPGLKGR